MICYLKACDPRALIVLAPAQGLQMRPHFSSQVEKDLNLPPVFFVFIHVFYRLDAQPY